MSTISSSVSFGAQTVSTTITDTDGNTYTFPIKLQIISTSTTTTTLLLEVLPLKETTIPSLLMVLQIIMD